MAFQKRVRTVSLCAIALVASAWACTADDPPTPVQTSPARPSPVASACTEPRSQMCPMIYMPVCGVAKDGSEKAYPNSCIACSNASVVRSTPGKCSTSQ